MTAPAPRILLVGCGKMGGALLRGVLAANVVAEAVVVDPGTQPEELQQPGITWLQSLNALDAAFTPDIVLIAVKPQILPDVLPSYGRFRDAVFLSIAAGLTLARLATLLGNPSAAVLRAMPNLPVSVGAGASVAVANKFVTAPQRHMCERLLQAVGLVETVEDEPLLEAVTALSGSGPAYVFALCEAMAKAGAGLGLSSEMAARLARQTMIGAGRLLAESGASAAEWRQAVTSPNGATEAALKILLASDGIDALLKNAMTANAARARELAQ